MTSTRLYESRLCSDPPEFRTLTLERGEPHDPIRCTLHTHRVPQQHDDPNRPRFIALSYVWGDTNIRQPIFVNGIQFQATTNLVLALQHIRKLNEDQVLWVDAICINQNDVEERNRQVRIMAGIFYIAEELFIWLGEADSTTEELVGVVGNGKLTLTPPAPGAEDDQKLRYKHSVQVVRACMLYGIIALRPWWHRVWTVQECILPRKDPQFLCGSWSFSWKNFYNVISNIEAISNIAYSQDLEFEPSIVELRQLAGNIDPQELHLSLRPLMSLKKHREQFQPTNLKSLSVCVWDFLGRQATSPHDYIYGYLSLATWEDVSAIQVDYQRSYWEVYQDFARLIFSRRAFSDLWLLTAVSFKSDSIEYPSWIPDFSAQRGVSRYTGQTFTSGRHFRSLKHVRWSNDGDILMLQGVWLDIVGESHPIAVVDAKDPSSWVIQLSKLLERIRISNGMNKTQIKHEYPPQPVVNASRACHQRLLFTTHTNEFMLPLDVDEAQLDFWWDTMMNPELRRMFDWYSKECTEPLEELGGFSVLRIVDSLVRNAFTACGGRSLISTQAGIVGLAVPNVRPGDVIVCPYGFETPMIMRPCKGHYRIVGCTYLAGLMDWTILEDCLDRGLLQEATFRIR